MPDRLVVMPPDDIGVDGPLLSVTTKTLEGLLAFQERWPGEMVLAARAGTWRAGPMHSILPRADLPFAVEILEDRATVRSRDDAAVTLAMHLVDNSVLLRNAPRRLVLYGEFPLSERVLSARLGARGAAALRAELGWRRRGPLLRRMVKRSGGFQANGHPAWDAYAPASPRPMLYYDTRVRTAHVQSPRQGSPEAGGPLRLAFSGRHTPAKGPEFAVGAALEVLHRGREVTLDVFGDGELTQQLKEIAHPAGDLVRFHGSIPFDPEWTDHVGSRVDLMLLPHVQGDPSGTYLEAAALGVPVLGFANRALQSLVDLHHLGWTVPVGHTDALAAKIVSLLDAPHERTAAGCAGSELMAAHTMEHEFSRRVAHLREVAQL